MAKLTKKIEIDALGMDKVQTMIDLLDKYRDELPKELQVQLKELADCDACEINTESLWGMGVNAAHVKSYVDGVTVNGIVSVNVILKRLTVYPKRYDGFDRAECNKGGFVESYKYPSNFVMNDMEGNKVLGWN